jgi:predicted enzyme related to lactoylglutathione lyase
MHKINECNVTVLISDMDRSVNFYQSLGMFMKQRWENHYAMLSAPGMTLGLHPGLGQEAVTERVSLGFLVDDINQSRDHLTSLGIDFTYEEGKSGKFLHFSDPDGTLLYVMEMRRG